MKFDIDKFRYHFTRNQASYEEIHENILEGMNVHGANFIILMCAIIIASIGLNMNSVAVIIGAMLISPLMGSIIGIGYGVGTYNAELLKSAFKILGISILISIITSTIYFKLTPITTAGSEILARTSPTIWDVIIAFVGGIAGMVGLTRNKSSNVIPGVAIATALMPPLCTSGYGIATKQIEIFLGAGYLFFINGFFISISTFIVTKALGVPTKTSVDSERQKRFKRFIITLSIIVMIPSMISAIVMIRGTINDKNLNDFINEELQHQYVLNKTIDEKYNTITLVTVGERITTNELEDLSKKLSYYGLGDKKLIINQNKSELSIIEKYINNIRNDENSFINNLNEIVKNKQIEFDKETIFKEIKAIYPEIEKLYIGYLDGETEKDSSIPIIIIYSDNQSIKNSKVNIENWFRTRMNSQNVMVYIENFSENIK
ncbi:DUF389 domain-containing protein [Romboutsia lituseburensis]|nr:DUF389 domain-containing protein [Romboutsia lituseburensis]